jgi:myo-inositol-1(or 4)-monophosphatase
MSRADDLQRIHDALATAAEILKPFQSGPLEVDTKTGDDPVTQADRLVDAALHHLLLRDGEGWLSEETVDDARRLGKARVWVVDPLDGTREFVARIPEWCVSIGLVEDGRAVAGGILNPETRQLIAGSIETGVELNGKPVAVKPGGASLAGCRVLASRSEIKRGEWKRFENAEFTVAPMGSVAFKLALVAAGLADATWTHVPKHEWDVAAGTALVLAAGGDVRTLEGDPPVFNQPKPKYRGLLAGRRELMPAMLELRPD